MIEAIYLNLTGSAHFGRKGIGIESTSTTVASDTLFSALCSKIRTIYGIAQLEKLLEAFEQKPPFLISDAFPYIRLRENTYLRFYPRPLIPPTGFDSPKALKKIKGVRFISRSIFDAWCSGKLPSEPAKIKTLQHGQIWVSDEEHNQLNPVLKSPYHDDLIVWATESYPHNTIDRTSSTTEVFKTGVIQMAPNCGLWFAVKWIDQDKWQQPIINSLRILGDTGLGGKRSIGYGQYKLIEHRDSLELPNSGDVFMTLSHYCPTRQEVSSGVVGGKARYELVARRGWMSSPNHSDLMRQSVRMAIAGSIFVDLGQSIYGHLIDVSPVSYNYELEPYQLSSHPVYRYGFAFPVGMQLVEGD